MNVGGTVASISVGTNRSCAVLTTGGMRCWGQGAEFPLGYGNCVTIGDNELPNAFPTIEAL